MNEGGKALWESDTLPDAPDLDRALDQLSGRELDEILALLMERPEPSSPPEPVAGSEPSVSAAQPVFPPELLLWPESAGPESFAPPEMSVHPETAVHPELDGWPEPGARPEAAARGDRWRREMFEWVRALVSAIVFVGVLNLFFVRVIGVSGDSMNPTLENGQRLLISNLFYRPAPGDIVIFAERDDPLTHKPLYDREPLVKRVIAVEGQFVNIDFHTGEVWVDNVLQEEPYIKELTHNPGDQIFPLAVPPGCLFVMGDNRNDSLDSRWTSIGLVDEQYVLGHVLLRVWPFGVLGRI